ncbi:uncharacterized protein LOC141674248 [Apium graveolens]|uniref:uncharacterized protein LOC141674248 n=1 Tax=Apium graveolens TaxID=4045 RepID=UPI003D7BBD99
MLDRDSKTTKNKYARQVYNLYQFGLAKRNMPMTFSTEDYEYVIRPHEDPIIINPPIGQNKIWKVLVDTGSSANILFHKTYCKMNLAREKLEPCNEAPLYAFGGHPIQFEGTITLPVLLGKLPYTVEKPVKFYVVWIEIPYNTILGRPFLSTFEAVESIPHLMLKFPTEKWVGEMRSDQKTTRIIMLEDLEKDQAYENPDETGKRKRAEAEPSGSRERRGPLYPNDGRSLRPKRRSCWKLILLKKLSIPDWLANVVVVKKSNGKWRICVDYMDLNKACPKDHYTLPSIDQLIDASTGYQILSSLDAFSGNHEIAINDKDVPNTAFITPKATYAYIKMPFGLKNAGATFQRIVNKVFKEQNGRNMEAYIDDMPVKSLFQDHTKDLRKCFETL